MTRLQAYRFELDPTAAQRQALASHAGAARFAYNWGLAHIKAALDAGVQVSWSAYGLRKDFNAVKATVAPWWADNSKEAYANGLADLAAALKNWSASKKGTRRGRRVGFPRFKKRGRARDSFRFTTGALRVCDDRRHVVLPRVGTVRVKENTRKLQRKLAAGNARIKNATVARTADRWYVSFCVEVERDDTAKYRSSQSPTPVGIDLGVKTFATCSDGTTITHPCALEHALRRLRRLNKELHRRTPGSANRAKSAAKLARAHARVANIRNDFLHQVTTRLARTKQTIVIEDLHVAGLLGGTLARHIGDAGWGEFRRQLTYKADWYGCEVIVAPRFFASSKMCSACGTVRADLALADRTYRCAACGFTLDRDADAARNLVALAGDRPGSPSGGTACGETGSGRHPGVDETGLDEAGTSTHAASAA